MLIKIHNMKLSLFISFFIHLCIYTSYSYTNSKSILAGEKNLITVSLGSSAEERANKPTQNISRIQPSNGSSTTPQSRKIKKITAQNATIKARYKDKSLKNTVPHYPLLAQKNDIEGKVTLQVNISKTGHPTQIKIHQSSGYKILDNEAIEAVTNWKFLPATRNNSAIESSLRIPIIFKLI